MQPPRTAPTAGLGAIVSSAPATVANVPEP